MRRLPVWLPYLKKITEFSYGMTLATQIVILISGMINSIVLARSLGVEGRGEIAAIMLWPVLLVYMCGLGLTEATLFFASQKMYTLDAIHTSGVIFSLLLSIITIPIGYFILPLVLTAQSPFVIELSRVFLLVIPLGMLLGHYSSLFRARLLVVEYNILILFVPLGLTISAFILIHFDLLRLETLVAANLLLYVCGILYAWYVVIRQKVFSGIQVNIVLMTTMLKYGGKVHLGTMLSLANFRLDQVLLASIVSPTQLGLYMVAVKLSSISGFLTNVVTPITIPRIAQYPDGSSRVISFTRVFRIFWWVSVILKLVYIFVLPFALPLLYGDEFSAALLPSIILVIASLFLDAKTLLTSGAQILNSPWLGSKAEIISSVFTIVLLIVLLPFLGIVGAALVSLGAYAIGMIVLLKDLKREHHLSLTSAFIFVRFENLA